MLTREQPFRKSMRLCKPEEFRNTFANGRRKRGPSLRIIAVKNGLMHPRLGLAVSRKSAKHAVQRNRIKRVIRESFRANIANIDALDIVVQATSKTQTQTNRALAEELAALWREVN